MRDDLLKATPLGSSFSEVEKKLKARRLPLAVSLDAGFTRQELFHPPEVVGEKSIGTRLGSYRSNLLTETIVIAYWGFDKNGSLIEIWVEEQNDSL